MTTSWERLERNPPLRGLRTQTTDPVNHPLFQWGVLAFKVWPLNVHDFDLETDTDWAVKPIAGAANYREWVGENDESIFFRGRLFPYRIGGFSEIEIFDAHRRAGYAALLIQGTNPGRKLGWFVCEKLVRSHTFLGAEGIGQQIAFEANLVRVPTPAYQETFFQQMVRSGAVAADAASEQPPVPTQLGP
jgi:phage protein U